jgi:hypothetical protein
MSVSRQSQAQKRGTVSEIQNKKFKFKAKCSKIRSTKKKEQHQNRNVKFKVSNQKSNGTLRVVKKSVISIKENSVIQGNHCRKHQKQQQNSQPA